MIRTTLRLCLIAILLLGYWLVAQLKPMPLEDAKFSALMEEFIYQTLAFSPVTATAQGLHQRRVGKQLINFDMEIDDYSPAALQKQVEFFKDFKQRLKQQKMEALSAAEKIDYRLMAGACEGSLLELERIQNYKHNPTVYVELIGNALFGPLTLEYAPQNTRVGHILARMEKIPRLVEQAKANLEATDPIFIKVALEENQGNLDMIKNDIQKLAQAGPAPRKRYAQAAPKALAALEDLAKHIREELPKRGSRSWRLGSELYDLKFKYTLQTDLTPAQLLKIAEDRINDVYDHMYALSMPLHARGYPHREHMEIRDLQARKAHTIREVLDLIAAEHTTPEKLMAQAQQDLDDCVRFVREKNILPLTEQKNLKIIPTPVFMRGIYGVAGFQPAPLLEPQLGAFYWVTPIPPEWKPEQVESKLREYNLYKYKLLTMHEGVPGHYTQAEYANRVQPQIRRVLRGLFGNGPYVEGWGQYIEEVMLEEGFLSKEPRLALTFLKEELRALANTILDIRLHRLDMTDEAAMRLMERTTFQEKSEAVGKLQRAKLSSTQLCYYFLGWTEWRELRKKTQAQQGASFDLAKFHHAVLSPGAIPIREFYSILGVPQ